MLTAAVCLLVAAFTSIIAPVAPGAFDAHATPSRCRAADLTVRIEHGDGRFTGMSHDGAIVVVRNVAARDCTLDALPDVAMRDARGDVVARARPPYARAMHPGPYVAPVVLQPGEIAASTLRWLTGNVFGDEPAREVRASSIALSIDGVRATAPLIATIWTRAAEPAVFGMERFTTSLPPLDPETNAVAGTYVGEGPAGATYLGPGGIPARKLSIRAQRPGTLAFRFDGLGGSSPNLGSISGSLAVHGTRAQFDDPRRDCTLTVRFYATQLTVEQTGTCGFGNAVTAQGRYRLVTTGLSER